MTLLPLPHLVSLILNNLKARTLEDDFETQSARYFYQSVSTSEELPKILNPRTADDHLLRIQADAIIDHTRIYRVMRNRAAAREAETLLLDEFRFDFDEYLSYLPEIDRMIGETIPSRYILTNNYDAMCLKTDGGRVIIVSEVLRYFLYFMNLANLNFEGVPDSVRYAARLIAVRTLLLSEALDFDLDPRGIIPDAIHRQLEGMVRWQMKFVIGHEYAHHNLGHSSENTYRISAQRRILDRDPSRPWEAVSRQHAQEFEADLRSIEAARERPEVAYSLFAGGTSFLLGLFVFELVADAIDPDFASITTHPATLDRFMRLTDHFKADEAFQIEEVEKIVDAHRAWAEELIDHYRARPDVFTTYGSFYLEEWRGRVLRDRIDY